MMALIPSIAVEGPARLSALRALGFIGPNSRMRPKYRSEPDSLTDISILNRTRSI